MGLQKYFIVILSLRHLVFLPVRQLDNRRNGNGKVNDQFVALVTPGALDRPHRGAPLGLGKAQRAVRFRAERQLPGLQPEPQMPRPPIRSLST